LVIGLPILLLWIIGQGLVLHYLDIEPPAQPIARWLHQQAQQGLNFRLVFLIFLAVVAAPVTEELLFRGMIYLPLRKLTGTLKASIGVSLIFAGVHGYAAGLGHLFILAMILAWLVETTETMILPIVVHGIHNGTMIALMFLFGGEMLAG
ncbi:MAG: CPBP family intramembrane glutamic endopeptidase, partial [Planctomycetota bacterium]